ncbi:60S ribosomal protein L36-2 [Sesamum angolense]|uniref:60S ribosomal protein L36-2 n=1 Tax=Sesamum angolense TaxID=2727404 RepID=A0AAE1XH99_9LAMI|nr:60S ribosomal protein L36-2 [Sesamum angolense]
MRITNLLKVGKDKSALRMAKRKLGDHKKAKKKREEMALNLGKMRAARGGVQKNQVKRIPLKDLLKGNGGCRCWLFHCRHWLAILDHMQLEWSLA